MTTPPSPLPPWSISGTAPTSATTWTASPSSEAGIPTGLAPNSSLVIPEADLNLLYDMERDPIGWLRRHGADLNPSARSTHEAQLVNVTVRVKGQPLSGALRGIAVTLWALAIFPGLHFLGTPGRRTGPS